MEKCDNFSEANSHNAPILSKKCTILQRKKRRANVETNFDISYVDQFESEKFTKVRVNQKFRSVYLKRYVFRQGVKQYRRPEKAFLLPIFHVSRKPDNPFNVKNVVANLRKKLMTYPLNKLCQQNQSSPNGKEEYSNLEKIIPKTRNLESIRYKYQLDYKEKLKMERENYLKDYQDNRNVSQVSQRAESIRTIYENMAERMKEVPRNVTATKEQVIGAPKKKSNLKTTPNRHVEQGQQFLKLSLEGRSPIPKFGAIPTNSEDSIKFYNSTDLLNKECESVDLTKDNDVSIPTVKQARFDRNEQGNAYAEITRNKRPNSSDAQFHRNSEGNVYAEITRSKRPNNSDAQLEHGIPTKVQHKDFDFSIPFNESNILIKVMTPEVRKPVKIATQGSLLQETLQHGGELKQESNTKKRPSCNEEVKSNPIRLESSFGNQWIQYIQNILKKSCDPQKEHLNKKVSVDQSKVISKSTEASSTSQSNDTIPKNFIEQRPTQITATIQKPSNLRPPPITATTNFYDVSSIGGIRVDRPVASNPRLIRPKVVHPSPYFRPDLLRNEPMEENQMALPATVPRQPTEHTQDSSNIPQHMEYLYSNHLNYHPEFNMVRSMRLPVDVPHPNLMGQPVYSPYDPPFMQYRNDIERMPHPCIDPYVQHNMHVPPLNTNLGYLPPRPTAPGMYRYLNPQLVHHPLWIYPHILER